MRLTIRAVRSIIGVIALALFAGGAVTYVTAADAPASPTATDAARVTRITVTASEFKFKLSRNRLATPGTVSFRVVNAGRVAHDFKIAGKKTPVLSPGQRATLKVAFKKKGKYAYRCTLPGHAAAGMKGVFGVGAKVAPPPPPATPPAPTGQQTTVRVDEFEFGFTLSQTTIPAGTVTFAMTNSGTLPHNFHVQGVAGAVGPILDQGRSATMTVNLTRTGTYTFICDVPGHADAGMKGSLTIQ